MVLKNLRLYILLGVVVIFLLIPLVAMQLTNEVNWSGFDFAVMGFLLLTTVLICEFILRKVKSFKSRLLICGAALFLFLLVWAELAVGVFGSPLAGS